jgi:hypothetical protein
MNNINKFKILIVGLTSVLALTNNNKNDFRKSIEKNDNLSFKDLD